jgi:lipopolysaccharide export system protein LptC
MTTEKGDWLALTADSGTYRPQPQLLDLFGEVELFQDKGNQFKTDSAHIDMINGSAEGDDAVEGHGTFGSVEAEGFRIKNQGDIITFTGKVRLVLQPRETKEQP